VTGGPPPAPSGRMRCSYVLPLRLWRPEDLGELTSYLDGLCELVDQVLVVDGSDAELFARHGRLLPAGVEHREVDPAHHGANGKVSGVLTGLDAARHERVVIADDDVRYDRATLEAVLDALALGHVVRPQNVFRPLPWHARWDTARSLLNRAVGADYPGTLAVRHSVLEATGGYDPDVLFENLELLRTVAAAGGCVVDASHVYVERRPPTTAHFVGQRVRQAYDSFASPARLGAELAIVPGLVVALAGRRPRLVAVAAVGSVVAAERGRRRHGGTAVFGPTAALFAPLWLLERGVCAWLAMWQRVRFGGVAYAGTRLGRAATPTRVLRRRLRGRTTAGPDDRGAGGPGATVVPERPAAVRDPLVTG
jgi:hypothetical protein